MFTTKMKTGFVALLALAVLGAGAGLLAYRSSAAEPAPGAKAPDEHLQQLLRDRLDAAKAELDARKGDFEAGRGTLDILLGSARRVLQSQRELNTKKADQIAAIEAYLDLLKSVEQQVKQWFDAGRVQLQDYKVSEYYRLDAEIMLERAKAN